MRKRMFLVAVLGLLLMVSPVSATMLAPNATVSPVPISSGSAAILADTGLQAFSFANVTGTVTELVLSGYTGNPLSGLSFAYQVTVTSGQIEHLTGFNFAGFQIDVVQDAGSGGSIVPGLKTADSAGRSLDGTTVSFNFNLPGLIAADGPSYTLIINTDAPRFFAGTIGVIDGGGQTLQGYAPTPEPSVVIPVLLLSIGLLVAAGRQMLRRSGTMDVTV